MNSCGLRSLKREFARYNEHDELQRSTEERAPRTPTPSFASCISDCCSCQQSTTTLEAVSATSGRSPVPDNPCCLNLLQRISCTMVTTLKNFLILYRTVSSDRFTWQLFKSIIFFTLGLKLFNDIARHMAKNNE